MKRIVQLAVIAAGLGILVVGQWAYRAIEAPLLVQTQTARVPPGSLYQPVLRDLISTNLNLPQRAWLRWYAASHPLQEGWFVLESGYSFADIVRRLAQATDVVSFTVVEGDNMYQVAEKLENTGLVSADAFLAACRDTALVEQLTGVALDRCEGYLYPETYMLAPYSSAPDLVRIMVQQFWETLEQRLADAGMPRSNPRSILRIVTLASIVEKETGAAFERPLIASVFLNRLIRGMKIQSDPTTIYGIWETFDGNLRRKDLRAANPYNTYYISALPPTPIANPGRDAIEAVLNPAASNYLYFVAKGRSGEHYFSHSYAEHRKAVARYQLGQGG